jgi:hypothetical protein
MPRKAGTNPDTINVAFAVNKELKGKLQRWVSDQDLEITFAAAARHAFSRGIREIAGDLEPLYLTDEDRPGYTKPKVMTDDPCKPVPAKDGEAGAEQTELEEAISKTDDKGGKDADKGGKASKAK